MGADAGKEEQGGQTVGMSLFWTDSEVFLNAV